MKILEFDFGAEDARYLNLKTPIKKMIFTDSFLFTPGFDLSDFYEGRRYFVHGLKGSGKSALLQYIRVKAEGELRASCQFYHFQSTFSSTEIQVFKANLSKSRNIEDIVIDDTELTSAEDLGLFWRMFILIEVGKLLRRGKIDTPAVHAYLKVLKSQRRSLEQSMSQSGIDFHENIGAACKSPSLPPSSLLLLPSPPLPPSLPLPIPIFTGGGL